jgi:hypothetical protein
MLSACTARYPQLRETGALAGGRSIPDGARRGPCRASCSQTEAGILRVAHPWQARSYPPAPILWIPLWVPILNFAFRQLIADFAAGIRA